MNTNKLLSRILLLALGVSISLPPILARDSSSDSLARPAIPCLTANSGTPGMPGMIHFARSIISKYPPPPPPPKRHDGLATILGNWAVPTEKQAQDTTVTVRRTRTVMTADGPEQREETGKEEKEAPVENVEIFLCKYPDVKNGVLGRLGQFGTTKGLEWRGLGEKGSTYTWPANYEQANELERRLKYEALQHSFAMTKTDKQGDYHFDEIPAGSYMLFGSVCTKKQLLIWLIPGETAPLGKPIVVNRIQQFRFDFIEKTGVQLWEAGHPAAPPTPPSYFQGTSIDFKNAQQ